MKNKRKKDFFKLGLMLMAVFLSPLSGFASDSYWIESEDINCHSFIWDMSGNYDDEFLDCDMELNMSQDGKGKIVGSGCVECYMYLYGYDFDFDFCYDLKGSITQKNGVASVKLSMNISGSVDVPDEGIYNQKFKGSETITAEINPYNQTLIGTAKVQVSIKGHSSRETVDFYEDLPYDMDGNWSLQIEVDGNGKKMVGDSLLSLANGTMLPFAAKGTYNVQKEESKFSLKGVGNASGAKLSPVIDEWDGDVLSISGKVLGQTIKCQ